MLFADWLDLIISEMNLKNLDIAEHSGIHQSTISRLRRADRLPSLSNNQVEELLNSVFRLSLKKNPSDKLKNLLGQQLCQQRPDQFSACNQDLLIRLQVEISKEKLTLIALSDIFHETARLLIAEDYARKESDGKKYLSDFSKKLDHLMQLFSITNAELANSINFDNSLISRWRNGSRIPQANNVAIKKIADFFADIITARDLKKECEPLDKAQKSFLLFVQSFSQPDLSDNLLAWFQNVQTESSLLNPRSQRLLKEIDKYLPHSSAAELIDIAYLEELMSSPKHLVYHHISGLREAIVRFLAEIIISDKKHTLLLFSNQKMDWLDKEPRFMKIWELLMYTLLCQGHKIEIIHTFGRSGNEISIALEKWLPLYLKGEITPYTCDRLNLYGKNQSPLVKTLFINPGCSAINAELIQGNEENSGYFYYTSGSKLQDFCHQFEQLKELSEPVFPILLKQNSFITELIQELDQQANSPESKAKIAIIKQNLRLLKAKVQTNKNPC